MIVVQLVVQNLTVALFSGFIALAVIVKLDLF